MGTLPSLQRRIAAMHVLWQRLVSDMSLEQVNHHERSGVLPIAFSLLHYVKGEDRATSQLLLSEPLLWDQEEWAERVGINIHDADSRGTPVEIAEQLRFSDLNAWREYQTTVFQRTDRAISELPEERLNEPLYGGQIPEPFAGAFITLVIEPGGPIRLVDALECFIYQHGIRHLGEIEHARALVGLGGMT